MSENFKMPIEDIMGERFGRYSKYIIQERALPDVRDGLKPVQRRILYAMHHEGNDYNKPYRKSAKTVGNVIGNYHPHGDSSVYDAMVRLSQPWKMNHPLVDMQGNNGSIDDDPAAAMRYTEARLSETAHTLLENIDEEVVPFVLNFDDMTTEPSVLPAKFPHLLVNGATGIAAGYATNIPPFNFDEVIEAAIYRLNHPKSDVESLKEIIKGPDFPTGAIIEGQEGIDKILETGRGRIVVRAKADIKKQKGRQQIIITELPYEVIKSNLVRKIEDLRFKMIDDGLGDVMDVRDESDRNGLRIVIDCKANADAESILNLFYKHTELQVYYNANMVAIVDERPVVCGITTILDAFLAFREDVVLKRSQYRYAKKEKRLHIIEGLMKATSILDEIIAIIRASKNRRESYENLMERFDFSQIQAEAIVDLQLYRLSSTDIVKLKEEFALLSNELYELKQIIEEPKVRHFVMTEEFKALLAQFSTPRRSEIRKEIADLEVDHLSLIPEENMMLTLSEDGYLKRVSLRSYGSSPKNSLGIKEDDSMIFVDEVSTVQTLLYFTSFGRYGVILVHDIIEARWRDVGSHLNEYVSLEPQEVVVDAMIIDDFNDPRFIVTTTALGMIKKTAVADFELKRTGQLSLAMNLNDDDSLVSAQLAFAKDEIVMITHLGQALRLSLDTINAVGPRAKGVIGMRLKDDRVVSSTILSNQSELLFITERNEMKRFKVEHFPMHNRATMGMAITRWVKSNPHYLKAVYAKDYEEEIVLFDEDIIAVSIAQIPIMKASATFSNVLSNEKANLIKRFGMLVL